MTRRTVFQAFGSRLDGSDAGLALVVFTEALLDRTRDAFQKSFAAMGYGPNPVTFADIADLDAKAVFRVVEGVDPLCLVAADGPAAELCSNAVREPFPLLQPVRLFGRDARAFPHVNELIETEAGRQTVWHLIKGLPHA